MNKHEITRHLDDLAGEVMPASLDLWPRVRAGLAPPAHRRTAAARRKALALVASVALVCSLGVAALSPGGTNAASGALGLIGLQPLSAVPATPLCTDGKERIASTVTPVDPGSFTVTTTPGEPTSVRIQGGGSGNGGGGVMATGGEPGATPTFQAAQLSCPEGYTLSFEEKPGGNNAVLSFFGVAKVGDTPAGPRCVNADGESQPLSPPAAQGTAAPPAFGQGAPRTASASAVPTITFSQVSCPDGFTLTLPNK